LIGFKDTVDLRTAFDAKIVGKSGGEGLVLMSRHGPVGYFLIWRGPTRHGSRPAGSTKSFTIITTNTTNLNAPNEFNFFETSMLMGQGRLPGKVSREWRSESFVSIALTAAVIADTGCGLSRDPRQISESTNRFAFLSALRRFGGRRRWRWTCSVAV
jgi:hypothetical protein